MQFPTTVLLCVAAVTFATALPTPNPAAQHPTNRDGRFIIPMYTNGVVPGAGAPPVAHNRAFFPGTSNNALIQALMRLILPAEASLPSSTLITTPNADGATPTAYLYSPLTGYIPAASNVASGRQLLTNPCENSIDCTALLLQHLFQQPAAFNTVPRTPSLHLQNYQSFPTSYAQYPQVPTLYSQPQQQQFQHTAFTPNIHLPVVIGNGPAVSQSPSPQLVLYNSPLSFLESLSESESPVQKTQQHHQPELPVVRDVVQNTYSSDIDDPFEVDLAGHQKFSAVAASDDADHDMVVVDDHKPQVAHHKSFFNRANSKFQSHDLEMAVPVHESGSPTPVLNSYSLRQKQHIIHQ